MFSLPNAVSETIQIVTSLKRIEKFVFAKEISQDHITRTSNDSANAIEISNGNFYWKREEKKDEKDEEEEKEQEKKDKKKGKKGKKVKKGKEGKDVTIETDLLTEKDETTKQEGNSIEN